MRKKIFFICSYILVALFLDGCFHYGSGSKYVKFDSYVLASDGNNGDSNFFYVTYKNKGPEPLKNPYLRMVIKDTSDKIFKKILFSDSRIFSEVPGHSDFTIKFFAGNYIPGNDVGKVKFYLEWTNKKGKKSVKRTITN